MNRHLKELDLAPYFDDLASLTSRPDPKALKSLTLTHSPDAINFPALQKVLDRIDMKGLSLQGITDLAEALPSTAAIEVIKIWAKSNSHRSYQFIFLIEQLTQFPPFKPIQSRLKADITYPRS